MPFIFWLKHVVNHRAVLKVIKLAAQSVTVRVVVIMTNSVKTFFVMRVNWLHLQDEVTAGNINVLRVKDTAAALERSANLMPAVLVELIEIISPGQVKSALFVPVINLDIIKEKIPWHIRWIQALAPGVESWCPEVHS